MQVILRVSGTGVTPFGPAKQERLIQVLAYGAGNISSSTFSIILIADAFSSRRRALLSWPWDGLTVTRPANLGGHTVHACASVAAKRAAKYGWCSARQTLSDYSAVDDSENDDGEERALRAGPSGMHHSGRAWTFVQ